MSELDLGLNAPEPPIQHQPANVTWIRYRPKNPVHCDACLAEVHAAWPKGTHAPNRATYRRRDASNGVHTDMYYCSVHADPRRQDDDHNRGE